MPSRFSCVRFCATLWTAAHRFLCPQDTLDRNTGVGCHFLLQDTHTDCRLFQLQCTWFICLLNYNELTIGDCEKRWERELVNTYWKQPPMAVMNMWWSGVNLLFWSLPVLTCFWMPHQFSSVTQSCLTLCDPVDCSMPGFPVHHQLPEFAQTHVHRDGDANQPSHPLSSPSSPAFNLPQHQGLYQWVSSSRQVARVLEFQLQHQSIQWIFRTDFL